MIDLVNHPPHYKTESGIEAIDVIEQYGLGYHLGNAMKYLLRAGRKDPAREREDLEKARWYIKRWLAGISERHGITFPDASPTIVDDQPEKIADAFCLTGERRTAATAVLHAAIWGAERNRIGNALAALDEALA